MRLLLALLSLLGSSVGCGLADPCENDPVIDIPSTGAPVAAWVFVRGCGATARNSVQVSILPTSSGPPTAPGNTLIVDREVQVAVSWPEPRTAVIAVIAVGSDGEILKQEQSVHGVTVLYERVE